MGGEPTIWDWLIFWAQIVLVIYAFCLFLADRVPFLAGLGRSTRRASWWVVDHFGDWLIRWIYWPLFKALWRLVILLWDLPGILWSGPAQPAEVAPVSRITTAPPAAYVAPSTQGAPQSTQTGPASVCLSAPEAPIAPPTPPALLSLILDSGMSKDERREAATKESLLAALIAAGWGYSEIRDVVKANNNTFPAEFEAARARLTQPAPAPRQTPVAGRELAEGVAFPQ